MKIETIVKSHLGQSVKYSNSIKVTYDKKGVAEVSSEVGKYLIEHYIDQIFPAGKVVIPEPSSIIPKKSDNGEILELKEQLQRANKLANDCKTQAQAAKDGEAIWRTKCEELLEEIKVLKGQKPAEQPKELTLEQKIKEERTALRLELSKKKLPELVAIAVELKLPEEEYKSLNRGKLIEYLISKTTNATS